MIHLGHDFRVQVVEGIGGGPSYASLWCRTCWSVHGTEEALMTVRVMSRFMDRLRDLLPHVAAELAL